MDKYKKLVLDGREILFSIKSYRQSKKVRLKITTDGLLKISKPYFVNQKTIEKFIQEKQKWILEKITYFQDNFSKIKTRGYERDRDMARELIKSRLAYFKNFYTFEVNKIVVRNQKTRWGSCSAKNNLNFNYRILYLPQHLADYIIVHEICHLFEMNHSPDFWALVEQQIPDYKARRKELRKVIF